MRCRECNNPNEFNDRICLLCGCSIGPEPEPICANPADNGARDQAQSGPQVGDAVSLDRWDKTERPVNRMGNCTVTKVERVRNCESGWMVTVENPQGRTITLDSNWLRGLRPTDRLHRLAEDSRESKGGHSSQ